MRRGLRVARVALAGLALTLAYHAGEGTLRSATVSSLSYKGHENDRDANALVRAFPALVGTRLDDCQTCHRAGTVVDGRGRSTTMNPCSYCHLIPYPDTTLTQGAPANYQATLNSFGIAYQGHGRDADALRAIVGMEDELAALRYPGDSGSLPGQPVAPMRTVSWERMVHLPSVRELLLLNSHTQRFDTYATYDGVRVRDLLAGIGIGLDGVSSVTFIAPDGYAADFSLPAIDQPYPPGLYHSRLDPASFADPAQGFVQYPPPGQIPATLTERDTIPGPPWLLIAYWRDGENVAPCYLDAASGRLEGEGPYRLVVPQSTPGAPDRGSSYSPSGCDDGYDFDPAKDHNAGRCVRGVVAIRLNPMPAGYEEFDWRNGGWAMVARREIIVYGAGVTTR